MNLIRKQREDLFKGGTQSSSTSLPSGIITAQNIIPAPVQAILQAQFNSVGLSFDPTKLTLNKDNREALRELRATVDLICNNAKLLPQFARELKKAMKAATKQAAFNADLVKASLKEQAKIDAAQVDILLAMAGYAQKRDKQNARLERRAKIQQKTQEAQSRYYDATWGKEAQLIDARWEALTDMKMSDHDRRMKQQEQRKERAVKNQQWLSEV